MISDEAVEAAASVLAFRGFPKAPQPYLNKLWSQMSDDDEEIEVDEDLRLKRGRDSFRAEARAALEAALPHLLASQGCGTGHSADAGSLPALARYDAGFLSDYGGGNVSWWRDYIRAELAYAHDFYEAQMIANWPLDGGETVHSPAEREGSRDEPKNTLAHPQKGGEGC